MTDSNHAIAATARAGFARRRMLGVAAMAALAAPMMTMRAFAIGAEGTAASGGDPVERFGATLVAVMKEGKTTAFSQRFDQLAPVADQTFDLNAILRTSIGPRWDSLSPADQAQLQQAFRRYTVASFIANFDTYTNERFEVSGRRPVGGGEVVDTTLGGARLSYVVRDGRIVDVLADGSISRVAVQRSDFRGLLSQGGGSALLASLQHKVADLSGGALA